MSDIAQLGHNSPPRALEDICKEWLAAKADEDAAAERRDAAANEFIAILGAKTEGSKTHKVEGFKIEIKGNLKREVSEAIWQSIAEQIPENMRPVNIKESLVADVKGCRWLQENRPDLWTIAAQAITVRPLKTSVTVERTK